MRRRGWWFAGVLILLLLISGQLNHPSLAGREVPEELRLLEKPFRLGDLKVPYQFYLELREARDRHRRKARR